jgi:activator of HSP90 ATPase
MMTESDTPRVLPLGNAVARRTIISGAAVALGGFAMIGRAVGAPEKSGRIVPARAIHQEETIAAAPARIYEALLDSKMFSEFSGAKAEIDRGAGGAFSLFGGVITGRNIEEVPDARIVQAWRNNMVWPAGLYSIVRFALTASDSGTLVILDHTGFPQDAGEAESLTSGWYEHYWTPLRKYFA